MGIQDRPMKLIAQPSHVTVLDLKKGHRVLFCVVRKILHILPQNNLWLEVGNDRQLINVGSTSGTCAVCDSLGCVVQWRDVCASQAADDHVDNEC